MTTSGVFFLEGDVREEDTLDQLRLKNARCLLLLTGDEITNVEIAVQQQKRDADLPILIRVANLDLMHRANKILAVDDHHPCVNIHHTVARKVCADSIEHMKSLPGKETLIFTGFGRFTETYLREFIKEQGVKQIDSIQIIDPDVDLKWAQFKDRLSKDSSNAINETQISLFNGSQDDPRIWDQMLDGSIGEEGEKLVVLLGTALDQSNLKTAMNIRDRCANAYIMVRMFQASSFAGEVGKDMNLHIIDSAKELDHSISAWLKELKR